MSIATTRPTIIQQVRKAIMDWFDGPPVRKAALQARGSDLDDAIAIRMAVCLDCTHDRSCVGCPVFGMAINQNKEAAAPMTAAADKTSVSPAPTRSGYGGKEAPSQSTLQQPATMTVAGPSERADEQGVGSLLSERPNGDCVQKTPDPLYSSAHALHPDGAGASDDLYPYDGDRWDGLS